MTPGKEVRLQFDSWTRSFCARNDTLFWFLLLVPTTSNVLLGEEEAFRRTKKKEAHVSVRCH